ncbi:MAG TPA: hypothetical protein VFS21_12675 [Roseiflexaceae bacterium]|nr:hypothetical protein [Roseiflexaceae bacterium]
MRHIYRLALALLLTLIALPFSLSSALAHGHITEGDYELVIGFRNEPAYQGEPNGLDLSVTNTKTGEKVKDLAGTLKAEIIRGSAKRELTLRAQWGEDGAYTADILPTESGDYTWRIFGTINGTPIDVSMTSSPDTFSSVAARTTASFPAAEPGAAELAAQAQTALMVGAAGVVLGLAGLVVGIMGLRARHSAPAPTPARSTRAA